MSSKDSKPSTEKTSAPATPSEAQSPTPDASQPAASSIDAAAPPEFGELAAMRARLDAAAPPEFGELAAMRARLAEMEDANAKLTRALDRVYEERVAEAAAPPAQPASTEPLPTGLRVRNPGPSPRHYWPGRDGILIPGQVADVPLEHVPYIRKLIATGKLSTKGGTNKRTGMPYGPCIELTNERVVSAKEIIDREQAALDAT